MNGESAAVWMDKIPPHLMAKHTPTDIFSVHEFGLFYDILPDKTYIFKGIS
jgi:hypothetical protein